MEADKLILKRRDWTELPLQLEIPHCTSEFKSHAWGESPQRSLIFSQNREDNWQSKNRWEWLSIPVLHRTHPLLFRTPQAANLFFVDSLFKIAIHWMKDQGGYWFLIPDQIKPSHFYSPRSKSCPCRFSSIASICIQRPRNSIFSIHMRHQIWWT